MRPGVHRRPPGRLAQPEACFAMAFHARRLRLSGFRRPAGPSDRYRAGDEGAPSDLATEAGDGEPGARPDRVDPRLGEDGRVSGGREPGAMARPPAKPAG